MDKQETPDSNSVFRRFVYFATTYDKIILQSSNEDWKINIIIIIEDKNRTLTYKVIGFLNYIKEIIFVLDVAHWE